MGDTCWELVFPIVPESTALTLSLLHSLPFTFFSSNTFFRVSLFLSIGKVTMQRTLFLSFVLAAVLSVSAAPVPLPAHQGISVSPVIARQEDSIPVINNEHSEARADHQDGQQGNGQQQDKSSSQQHSQSQQKVDPEIVPGRQPLTEEARPGKAHNFGLAGYLVDHIKQAHV
ncbi:unnamed protein product [Mycena citricolor]|uniref:Uncharacterized protein n=1 Tax=Mycena citricolor TaxID=2018698 RepID=A0AAD2I0T2_9AGAR|nr:unnamed protein product [Mycena citricolor]